MKTKRIINKKDNAEGHLAATAARLSGKGEK